MPEEFKPGCARPTGGVVGGEPSSAGNEETKRESKTEEKARSVMVQVGKKAPDFTAPAYHQGKFVNVTLSEYLGKWTLLCFYPGDFTFV
jgi:hypothetical protein